MFQNNKTQQYYNDITAIYENICGERGGFMARFVDKHTAFKKGLT